MPKHNHIHFTAKKGKQDVVITSVIGSSRDRAFQAYIDPRLVPCWWGPDNLVTVVDKMLVTPGGEWRFVQRDAGGREYAFHGVYREILPPERLAYTFEYRSDTGREVKEAVTVTFEELRGKTKIVDRSEFESVGDRDAMLEAGMAQGAIETMDRFTTMLENLERTGAALKKAGNRGAVLALTRMFEAPRELVFRAWSEPERFKRWWGPKGYTAPHVVMDFCVGYRYLFCARSPAGKEYWNTGIFREIVPNEKISLADSFADEKGSPVPASYYGLEGEWAPLLPITVTFESVNGATRLSLVQSGLPAERLEPAGKAWNESLDKLAASLVERS